MTKNNCVNLLESYRSNKSVRNIFCSSGSFRNVNLNNLRANRVSFDHADLTGSDFSESRFIDCNLNFANLADVNLSNSVIRICELNNTSANHAIFVNARFENCMASGGLFNECDFSHATIVDTDFSRASLREANLSHANGSGAVFRGADLRNANLQFSQMDGVDFRGADLTGALLNGACLDGADLRGCIGFQEELIADSSVPIEKNTASLAESVAPIIQSVLATGADEGLMENEACNKLLKQFTEFDIPENRHNHNSDIPYAVAKVVEQIGNIDVNDLFHALNTPNGRAVPDSAKNLINELHSALELDENAGVEEILFSLLHPNKH